MIVSETILSSTPLGSTAVSWAWKEDMVHQRRRAWGRQEGIHRVPQVFWRRAGRETLLWRWKFWVWGCGSSALILLVLYIRELWQLQRGRWVPQFDGLGQEVRAKGERVVFSCRPTQGPWLCHGDEKEARYRLEMKHLWASLVDDPWFFFFFCLFL